MPKTHPCYVILHDDKTELIIIGGSKQLPKVSLDSIQVGECTVSPVQKVRNLGVIFDENLSMKDHISNVCKKGFYQLYRLRQVRKYFNRNTFEGLVHAFVTSHIDYGNAMLFGLPDVTIKKLERLQHAAARLILNRSWRDSATEMLKELHWLPIRYRILYKLSLLVFKCMNNIGPAYLKELLISKKAPRTLRSAELSLLVIPRVRTETFGKRAFEYAAPRTWNALPLHIRQSKDITIFKKVLKTHFFEQAFQF